LNGYNLNFGGVLQNYPYLPSLPKELDSLKPDVVHGESHLFLPIFQAVKKAKQVGVPSVVTVHGVLAERGFAINSFQNLYLRTIGARISSYANRIICLTKAMPMKL